MSPLAIVELVGGALKALAVAAPAVVEVFTGGKPVEELVEEARAKARAIKVLAGSGNAWDQQLSDRIAALPADEGE